MTFLPHEAIAILKLQFVHGLILTLDNGSMINYSVKMGYKSYWRVVHNGRSAPGCSYSTANESWWKAI